MHPLLRTARIATRYAIAAPVTVVGLALFTAFAFASWFAESEV